MDTLTLISNHRNLKGTVITDDLENDQLTRLRLCEPTNKTDAGGM